LDGSCSSQLEKTAKAKNACLRMGLDYCIQRKVEGIFMKLFICTQRREGSSTIARGCRVESTTSYGVLCPMGVTVSRTLCEVVQKRCSAAVDCLCLMLSCGGDDRQQY